jgi:hypothetical protein
LPDLSNPITYGNSFDALDSSDNLKAFDHVRCRTVIGERSRYGRHHIKAISDYSQPLDRYLKNGDAVSSS